VPRNGLTIHEGERPQRRPARGVVCRHERARRPAGQRLPGEVDRHRRGATGRRRSRRHRAQLVRARGQRHVAPEAAVADVGERGSRRGQVGADDEPFEVEARRLLRLYAIPDNAEQSLWSQLDSVYFQRHSADEIAWHARHLYYRVDRTVPVVRARLARDGAGLQVLVYLPDQRQLFARICGFFGRRGLSILDAKIHTTRHGFALDTFAVHDPASPNTSYRDTIQFVEFELKRVLDEQRPLEPPTVGRVSRHLRHFPLSPVVEIAPDDKGTHYILQIVAGDRPGLLARIAYTLASASVNVASARINTLGERAEDVFLIDGPPLHDQQALLRLETELYEQLRV